MTDLQRKDVRDEMNIVTGFRQRRPSPRRHTAYIVDLKIRDNLPGICASFAIGVVTLNQRLVGYWSPFCFKIAALAVRMLSIASTA